MSDKVQEYRGKHIVVRFDGGKCIHSRNCVLGRPDVFVPNAPGAWIQPDSGSPEAVAEIAHNCPSGAISYERLDSGAQEIAPKVNVVRVRENGPLAFHAELQMAGQASGYRATLCRCGASKNKPLCDGSHVGAGFTASGEPPTRESAALPQRDGTVRVKPSKNGPLLIEGNLEVVTGTGRTILRTRNTALCRCGGSANKPYCDGTHARIGFAAEAT
ncbi:MAG TPA: CDGSH iron-sulfur domain-containing protein [Burkholderiales bacterium]|nr:CDGSH iron-sulfur domain-containing protein [Burkholderiales bacterium]